MSSCKVYVGNLAWGTDDPTLGAHFAPIGQVKDAVVMRSEGRSRGFGFVTFSSVQEAEHAIATMNDTELLELQYRRNIILPTLTLTSVCSRNLPNRPDQQEQLQSGPLMVHLICPIDLRHSWETSCSLGNGVYQPAPFGNMYAQPNFVGYPPDMAYVSKLFPWSPKYRQSSPRWTTK
ncbi:hypothetical protein DFH28DRAFT_1082182 [Melampsora americana]|nr:hypothetical protein DFH28DRAFT_1082182 [Melampsora americana]